MVGAGAGQMSMRQISGPRRHLIGPECKWARARFHLSPGTRMLARPAPVLPLAGRNLAPRFVDFGRPAPARDPLSKSARHIHRTSGAGAVHMNKINALILSADADQQARARRQRARLSGGALHFRRASPALGAIGCATRAPAWAKSCRRHDPAPARMGSGAAPASQSAHKQQAVASLMEAGRRQISRHKAAHGRARRPALWAGRAHRNN